MNNIEVMCRGCMSPLLEQLFSIKDETMRDLFRKCTNLKIEEDDLLPKYLCKPCFVNCNQWKKFQTKCEESQIKFNKLISNKNPPPISEIEITDFKMEEDDSDEEESITSETSESDNSTLPYFQVTILQEIPDPLKTRVKLMISESSANQTNTQPPIKKPPPKYVYRCKECNQIFVNLEVYQDHYRSLHIKTSTDVQPTILCSVCRAMFTSDDDCLAHQILIHTVEIFPVKYTCNICEMEFGRKTPFLQHRKIHEQLTCKLCSKEFSSYKGLDRHIAKMHREPRFECEICKRKFKGKSELKMHTMRHTNQSVGCCQYCGKTFISIPDLQRHVSFVHELERKFQCHLCRFKSKTEKHLEKHIKDHTAEKKISCEFCPLMFKAMSTYKNHRMTHTGEKRYHCSVCNHGFIQKQALTVHMKVHAKIE